MTWYEQWFDRDEYELVYRDRDRSDAAQVLDLVLEMTGIPPGARVLDVGCGRGRHAIELATRGYQVTGLDLSDSALAMAKARADEAGVALELVQADMRDGPPVGGFDLVINLFTAFGYFEARFDHQRAIDAMAQALKPGGMLAQDYLNAPFVRGNIRPESRHEVDGTIITQTRWIEEDRIKKEITFERSGQSHAFFESVALLDRPDFERMYAAAGLTEVAVRGDYEGNPYSPDAPRLLLFARRDFES